MSINKKFAEVNSLQGCDIEYLSSQNLAYVKDLKQARKEIEDYRTTIKDISDFPFSKDQKGYFIPKDSIDELFAQDQGVGFTGLKVYFGKSDDTGDDGKALLDIIVIATIKEEQYEATDYKVPGELPENPGANEPKIAKARPCPSQCGKENALNKPISI
ncbi:hypothetical protein [Foetidibacter luteolus]|uniref:hypothetical protein n=1 Tax=Foetidibacter luteolus TaxID=2608880 RepID=UPI00129AAC3B|nr:hypothetical protein [Foetidibacter luteolus]